MERCRAWADFQGAQVVGVYQDLDISGRTTAARPEFLRLMADAKKGLFDQVVVYKCSRFARNGRDGLNSVHELDKLHVSFASVTESFDTSTPIGKFGLNMMFIMSQWQSDELSETVRDNKLKALKSGRWQGGPNPYGLTWLPEKKTFESSPEHLPTLLRIFSMAASGDGPQAIRRYLYQTGIPSPTGKPAWSSVQLAYLIRNPVYIGKLRMMASKRDYRAPLFDSGIVPVVGEETFWAANRAWDKNVETWGRKGGRPPRHPFGGILRCSACGGPYVQYNSGDDNSSAGTRLRCKDKHIKGCGLPNIRWDSFAKAFAQKMTAIADNAGWFSLAVTEVERHYAAVVASAGEDAKAAETALKKVEDEQGRLLSRVIQGIFAPDLIEREYRKLEERRRELENRLAAALAADESRKDAVDRVGKTRAALAIFGRWASLSEEEQRELVRDVVSSGRVYADRVEVELAVPVPGRKVTIYPTGVRRGVLVF